MDFDILLTSESNQRGILHIATIYLNKRDVKYYVVYNQNIGLENFSTARLKCLKLANNLINKIIIKG